MKRVKTKTKDSNKLQPKGKLTAARLGDGVKARKKKRNLYL